MNLPHALLIASAAAYLTAVSVPISFQKNLGIATEKALYLLLAALLLTNTLILDLEVLWAAMGALWSFAAVLSFIGVQKWNVKWRPDVSDAAQVFMAGWDLAIAVACFMQA